jgi:anhydro-N-acetylmuramic acid kinase
MSELYIGLMSGTSLDGVDGVLVDFAPADGTMAVHQYASMAMPNDLRAELLALNTPGGPDELHRAALAANGISRAYAAVVQTLLQAADVPATSVRAIGAHGQTVRHRPQCFDGTGYTLQLINPALLAERSGITVVADFRSRDIAAGGQGAPLVPAFHQFAFARQQTGPVLVLNLGGIANLSVLSGDTSSVVGFDCGPGNALMDYWCQHHTGQHYDAQGAWAATGQVIQALLAQCLQEPYLHQAPPKSTGRDLFNPAWLHALLAHHPGLAPADVQATLAELTATACAYAVQSHCAGPSTLAVCGGGALNTYLMRRLQALLPQVQVVSTDTWGLPVMQVEACAFAWLARQTLLGLPGNLPKATGAKGARVLGAIYPA